MGVLIELFFPPTSQSHGIPCQSIWGSRFEDSMSSVVPSTGTAISDYTIYVVPVFILNTMYQVHGTNYKRTNYKHTTSIILSICKYSTTGVGSRKSEQSVRARSPR